MQGLAHFLEHMLFLGSDAYPHPSDIRKVDTIASLFSYGPVHAESTLVTFRVSMAGAHEAGNVPVSGCQCIH